MSALPQREHFAATAEAVSPEPPCAAPPGRPVPVQGRGFSEADIRRQAIALHRAFAPVRALLEEVELLALNASVACGRLGGAGRTFGTVARDLHGSSATLRLRIDDVEGAFFRIAALVARWSRANQTIVQLQASIQAARSRRHTSVPGVWGPAWAPETRRAWSVLARGAATRIERRLWATLMEKREQLTSTVAELHFQIIALERHMDRIRWAAVRQIRYLRILANIERAHLHDRGRAVDAVVHAMAHLDGRLTRLEQAARVRVDALQASMALFSRAIWPGRVVGGMPRLAAAGSAREPAAAETGGRVLLETA